MTDFLRALFPAAHPSAPSAPAVIESVVHAGGPVLAAIEHVVRGNASASDAITIVTAILEGVAFVDPAAAPIVTLAIDLAPIAGVLIASGVVKNGSGANADVLGRGGCRA